MTITLQDFASGDTNYVAKMNSNNGVLESAIDALQAATTGSAGSTSTLPSAYSALFGSTVALIGASSYACTDGGSGNLSVAAGYCYRPTLGVLSKLTSSTISFTGQAAATYYVVIDSSGEPTRETSSTEAIYSVVWTGTAFGAITRLAAIAWGAADWTAAQSSTALSATYTTLDARLEAVEGLAGGTTARTANTVYAGPTTGSPAAATFRALVAADLPTQPYDVGGSYAGAPTASLVLVRYPFPRAVAFPASLTNSQGAAATAATAQTDFDLKKNNVSFGTMRFAASGTTATFIAASSTSFAAGDVLTVVAPATPDATLANIGFALAGTR